LQDFSAGAPSTLAIVHFAVSIGELERSFIAGFLEGEASLSIRELNGGRSLSCAMALTQRDDEQDTLEWLVALTGIGTLRRLPARAGSKPQIVWSVRTQADCRELLAMIEPCGFHGRRAAELCLWREAVRVWSECGGSDRRLRLRALKSDLAAARRFGGGAPSAAPFASRRQLLGYITGFVCAEGCFGLSGGRPRFSIHMRQDDEPLLRLLAGETGLGKVTTHRPAAPLNPTATWTVAGRAQLVELRDLLWVGGLMGRKLREMDVWGVAVDELNRLVPDRVVLEGAAERMRELRVYRPSGRVDLLRLPGRDLQAEALAALTEWGRASPGKLASTGYAAWRRDRRGAPTRNTIVREFGSWHRALAAAGLGDRAATSAETVAARQRGGAERRAARQEEQRTRVISAVLRFQRENGRLPRAVEFFRWRYEVGVDVPTQGPVYRLFPGGWAEVLERARQVAGATV
jgi:hypothetical protein